ncbi:MAG: ATP-binding protein [Planctomycetota bacterium]|jgi:signal transduction histidine kinase/ActR/RegA family two-component response regulator/tRNA A-37 threonylcarbamoyl transferase component Bud32|nr:ATP-binding protein [Planctomycetota bacterium]
MKEKDLNPKEDTEDILPYLETVLDAVRETYLENPRSTIRLDSPAPAGESPLLDENKKPGKDTVRLFANKSSGPSGFEIAIHETIGSGAMAQVDTATQCSLNREVALKRVHQEKSSDRSIASLVHEAYILARLDHPNIPPVYEFAFDEQGSPMILMKRVCGTTWSDRIYGSGRKVLPTDSPMYFKEHLEILRQVCFAVEYAHSKQVLHRDLKTENVMIGDFGEVFLMDWGLAIDLGESGELLVALYGGTPALAAPEMFDPSLPLTYRSDVYLLGSMLHEVLVQEPRHKGGSFDDVLKQILLSSPYPYGSDIPASLATIANKATQRSPELRFGSVREFREAVEAHLHAYQALELLDATNLKLTKLEEIFQLKSQGDFEFHQLAFQCRFGYQRVLEIMPSTEGAQRGVLRVLELQLIHDIEMGRVDSSRRLIDIMRQMNSDEDRLQELEERIRRTEELRMKADEISTQIQYRLQHAAEEAKKDSRDKSNFLANMSHEIRTPMNGIIATSKFLCEEELESKHQDWADTIYRSGVSLLRIIDDILDFSKIESGKLSLENVPFSPSVVIEDICLLLRSEALGKGLTLEVEIDESLPPTLYGDPARLRQILLNLLGNAIKFTERGGVRLCLGEVDSSAEQVSTLFSIEDTGIGMSPDECSRIFERFAQADTTTTRIYGGTGLGLGISRGLAQLMGGDIGVESELGKGSTFTISLSFEYSHSTLIDSSQDQEAVVGTVPASLRILVAEDNLINQQVTRTILEQLECEVLIVENGKDAVAAAAGGTFDLVFMDCQMPIMDGYEASQTIRRQTGNGALPIIALTAHALVGEKEKCLEHGMTDYLSKPTSREAIASKLLLYCVPPFSSREDDEGGGD